MRPLALTITLLLAAACQTASALEPASLVLFGGKIFTADPTHPWAEAIAIRGKRIAAVGTDREVRRLAGPDTRVIDLRGRVVVPGINDAHVHEPWAAESRPIDLSGVRNIADLLEAVREAVLDTPLGDPLQGELPIPLLEAPGATRTALDAVAPSHPVTLTVRGGHAALLNTAALRHAGISESAADPRRGWYGRREGRLDGWVYEHALWDIHERAMAAETDDALIARLRAVSAEAASLGITTLQTMSSVEPVRLASLIAALDLPVRWRVIAFGSEMPSGLPPSHPVKYVLDGTPIERNAALREPWSDRPGARGVLAYSDAEIRAILREAAAGRPILLHAVGDDAVGRVLRLMATVPADWPSRRLRLEHAEGLSPAMRSEARRLGVVIVQNPAHFMLPEVMHARLGLERMAWFQPVRTLIEERVRFALGSDGPMNPWLNVMFAVINPTRPEEALQREQAVAAYTAGAAFAEFQEAEKGTLAHGRLADLAVLSQDVFTVPLEQLPATKSLLTIVGGEIVHETEPDGGREPVFEDR